MLLIDSVASR